VVRFPTETTRKDIVLRIKLEGFSGVKGTLFFGHMPLRVYLTYLLYLQKTGLISAFSYKQKQGKPKAILVLKNVKGCSSLARRIMDTAVSVTQKAEKSNGN
jgi:hypothetical protein